MRKNQYSNQKIAINRNMFQFEYIIGKGGFGKVWRVQKKSSTLHYALKEMSKAKVLAKHSISAVMNERQILSRLKHPYFYNMRFC